MEKSRYPKWMQDDPMLVARTKIMKDGRFAACDNDEDRVKLTADGLVKHLNRVEKYPCEFKDSLKSVILREMGNTALKSNPPNLEDAQEYYSRSMLYAPQETGANELSLAYANRSAVLLRTKHYEQCLEDIDRALKSGYPDERKPKLLIRKAMCNYALTGCIDIEKDEALLEARSLVKDLPATDEMRKFVEDTIKNPERITSIERRVEKVRQEYAPVVKEENPQLPGASSAIALKYSEGFGRHVVATRDISTGEVLLMAKPFARFVAPESIHWICSHCTKVTWNCIPCESCVHVMFCSDECKQAAWSEYHDIECQVLGPLFGSGLQHHSLMGLRLTVKAIKEAGSIENLKKRLEELDSLKETGVEIPIIPNSYDTIYTMPDNPKVKSLDEVIHWTSNSVEITYFLATRTELFGKKLKRCLAFVKESEWFTFVAALMSKNMRIAKLRVNGITINEDKGEDDYQIVMMLPVYSYLNHRCYDTVPVFSFEQGVALITPFPIKSGEQIYTTYGESYETIPTDLRMMLYESEYHFVCDCLACKENWTERDCIPWKDQDLPPQLKKELGNGFNSIKPPDARGDPRAFLLKNLIPYQEYICKVMDFLYPRVQKPCSDVQIMMDTLIEIYLILSNQNTQFIEKEL